MAKGDHIRVRVKEYGVPTPLYHHGIEIGKDSAGKDYVIHFRKERKGNMPVIGRTPLEIFAEGSKVESVWYSSSFPPNEVVKRAEYCLMINKEIHYSFLEDNCEHMARWCKNGDFVSLQVEDARSLRERVEYFSELLMTVGVTFLGT